MVQKHVRLKWWLEIGCKLSEGKDKLHLPHDSEVDKQDKNKARMDRWLKIPSMAFQKDPKAFKVSKEIL